MKRLTTAQTKKALKTFRIEETLLPAFGFIDGARQTRYEQHSHSRHQLLLPLSGVILVETRERLHLCAPPMALWIPAGVRHATTTGEYPAASLYFAPDRFLDSSRVPKAISATALLRELVLVQTSAGRIPARIREASSEVIFWSIQQALVEEGLPTLPRPRSEALSRAVTLVIENLETLTVASLASGSGMSQRTLRRRFLAELHLAPEAYIQRVRLIKAMQLLLEDRQRPVIDVSLAVGYGTHSAFSAAFLRFTGKSPRSFRESPAR